MEASTNATPVQHWRYRIMAPLGSGGMGTVYRAYDRLTGVEVALKQVQDEAATVSSGMPSSDSRDLRLLLSHEFQMLASLRHPNIISVLDYGFDSEHQRPFFTMTLLEDAQTVTQSAQGKPQSEQAQLLLQVLMALEYLHTRGIIHRDLKPDNALVVKDNVHVLDFGLSILQSQRQEEDFIAGTLAYIAPEVLGQEDATEPADLYAVGVMLYEMLLDRHPFDLDTVNMGMLISQIMFEAPDVLEIEDGELGNVVDQLLEKDPTERYRNASAVIQDLCYALDLPLPEETYAIREGYLQSAPFVGRDAEINMLQDALIRTSDAQSEIWLLGGEVGVGKTRLLNELRIRALINGTLILHGQGVNAGRLPYQIWREPVRRLVLMQSVSDLDAAILKDIVLDISHLLERPIPDPVEVDAPRHHQRLIETISRLLRNIDEPILLLLEDLQWAAESLDVLQHLARDVDNLESLLIVGSYRSDEAPDFAEKIPNAKAHQLTRLDYEMISDLTSSILGEGGKRDELVRFLHAQSEGNVYFLVETIRALAKEAGQLRDVATMPIPDQLAAGGIHEVMMRRWQAVPEAAQRLLKYAALAGRELDLKVLANIVDAPELEDWLTTCSNAYILERANEMWQFTHDRLREAIIQSIADERSTLFRELAQAAEKTYPDVDEQASRLADYWQVVQEPSKELHYRQVAGALLLRLSALADAATQFDRALGLLSAVELDATAEKTTRGRINWQLGLVWNHRGEYAKADEYLQTALSLVNESDDAKLISQVELGLCHNAMLQGQYEAAIKWAQQCIERDQTETRARAMMQLGIAHIHQGQRDKATTVLQETLKLDHAANDKALQADVAANLGVAALHSSRLKEAEQYFTESLATLREIGERRKAALLLNNMGSVMGMLGDLEQAQTYFGEVLEIGTEIGSRRILKLATDNLGLIASMTEDYALANKYMEQSLGISLEIGDQPGYVITLTNIGHVARAEDRPERALKFYQQAIQAAQEIKAQPLLLEAMAGMASALADDREAALWLSVLRDLEAVTGETRGIIDEAWQRIETALTSEALDQVRTDATAITLDELIQKAITPQTTQE